MEDIQHYGRRFSPTWARKKKVLSTKAVLEETINYIPPSLGARNVHQILEQIQERPAVLFFWILK